MTQDCAKQKGPRGFSTLGYIFIIYKVGINNTNLRVSHRMKHDHENKAPSEHTNNLAHKWYSINHSSFPYCLIKGPYLIYHFLYSLAM